MTTSDWTISDLAAAKTTAIADDLFFEVAPPDTRQRFLTFALGDQNTVFLALEHSTEIIPVKVAKISPVPAMSKSIMGIYNWRSELLWLVDLNHLTGFSSPLTPPRYTDTVMAVVVCCQNQWLGLVVDHVEDITLHDPDQLQGIQSGIFPSLLEPFLLGYFPGHGAVIDVGAIAHHPLWKQHEA